MEKAHFEALFAKNNELIAKGRRDEQRDATSNMLGIFYEELERLPSGRRASPYELRKLSYRVALRIGRELQNAWSEQATQAYVAGLEDVTRDTSVQFVLGGIHDRALRTAIDGEGVSTAFQKFQGQVAQRFNEIIEDMYRQGNVSPGAVVTQMIDEVGFEARKDLERIARTETWKIWETARANGYEEAEQKRGEKFLYRFGTIDDTKTCTPCQRIMLRSQRGVTLDELREIIVQEAALHNPKWDPMRDGGFPLPHIGCRHRFWRTQGALPPEARAYIQERGIAVGAHGGTLRKSVSELPLAVEYEPGDVRTGTNAQGEEWKREMHCAYGRIKRTEGADGEELDFYLGDDPSSEFVLVINQIRQDSGEFDEHKLMLGFHDRDDALASYLAHYPDGWRVGPVKETSIDEVVAWIETGDTYSIMKSEAHRTRVHVRAEGAT